jgi:hypothetical protein
MGRVIDIRSRSQWLADNVISSKPLEFRRADWETGHFVQMLRSQSRRLETSREEIYRRGGKGIQDIPSHYSLKGGMAFTIRALFQYRESEGKMREVYYLAGLVDCMINQVNPVLRTDLLRDLYRKVFSIKERLKVHWHGPLDQVLLPIDFDFHNESEYRSALSRALTMKELYHTIKEGTDEMFDILSLEYVFYCPGPGK